MAKPLIDVSNQKRRPIPADVRVKYTHMIQVFTSPEDTPEPRRVTVATLIDKPTGKALVGDVAICGPRDTYRRKVGNHIALQRALKNLETWHEIVSTTRA